MLKGMFDLSSKMVWLGLAMIVWGVYKSTGIDIPGIPEHEIIGSILTGDPGTLINGGLAMLFTKTRIDKAA